MANVPYASTGVLGSSVGMDKIATKFMLRGAGLPVLDFIWFTREDLQTKREEILAEAESKISYPMFVKPATLGSSIGVSQVHNRDELEKAVDLAASFDQRILIEVGIENPVEVNCAVLGYADDVRPSVCEMPVSTQKEGFLTFWEKYLRGSSAKGEQSRGMKSLARVLPAPIGEELTETIQQMACKVFQLLNGCGTIRVDFIMDDQEVLYIGEVNTIPGSMAFYLWKAAGINFADLIDKMVENAMNAYADKNRNVYAFDSNILQSVVQGTKGTKS